MQNTLIVYSSNRALLQNLDKERLLPPHMLIGEFFKQVIIVDNYRALPTQMRLPLMLEVLKDYGNELKQEHLIFEESFLGYLESSAFMFEFFSELEAAQVDIKDISLKDTYGDYERHLAMLEKLESAYKAKLEALKYYDNMILPKGAEFRLNDAFIHHFHCIELYIDGLLSKTEQNLLSQIAKFCIIRVHFTLDNFNVKLPFLPSHILENCKINTRYKIDYDSSAVLESKPINKLASISAYHFLLRISQVALIFAKVNEWIKAGVNESQIVIIVPDEAFCKFIALFDRAKNFNFAMGEDITQCAAFKHLETWLKELKASNALDSISRTNAPKNALELESKYLSQYILEALQGFDDRHSKVLREMVSELLFMWEGFCLNLQDSLELLLEALKKERVDNISGGKVRVIGVLESRGFSYEKAVIVDFNAIPNVKDSDLFLNSKLRSMLGMPTLQDKEQLQRHYYYGIFTTANEVAISYVENDDSTPSTLLDILAKEAKLQNTPFSIDNGDKTYALLPQHQVPPYMEDSIKGTMPSTISPSKLKDFLECKRKFYYQNIAYLSAESDKHATLGNILHKVMHESMQDYFGKVCKLDSEIIKQSAINALESRAKSAEFAKLKAEIALLKCELALFLDEHIRDVEIEILALELDSKVSIGGFNFKLRADRIQKVCDKNGEYIEIIDYKYRQNFKQVFEEQNKDIEKCSDYAMALYKMAFLRDFKQYQHLPCKALYYDIKGNVVYDDKMLDSKCAHLPKVLESIKGEMVFEKCDNRQICRYCEFVELCDR